MPFFWGNIQKNSTWNNSTAYALTSKTWNNLDLSKNLSQFSCTWNILYVTIHYTYMYSGKKISQFTHSTCCSISYVTCTWSIHTWVSWTFGVHALYMYLPASKILYMLCTWTSKSKAQHSCLYPTTLNLSGFSW